MSAWVKKLAPRSPTEAHRVSTPLELFFDLVFVVAINFAAGALHHDFAEDHIRHGLISFAMVVFAISWSWVNFAWFASAYDNGDVLYRIAVFVQMTGALVLAAGIERAFAERDIKLVVIGYVIMRLALVSLWLRAALADPLHRTTDIRYAIGITLVQLAWIAVGFSVSEVRLWMFVVLAACELLVPVIAERGNMTTWHPEHIGERYGLFTIIVLGEAVLASALAIQTAVDDRLFDRQMVAIVAGSLVILYMMWWIYFEYTYRAEEVLTSVSRDFTWGYGHIVLWGAVAAVGVGIGLCIDFATHHAALSRTGVQAVLALAVTVYLISLWLFHDMTHGHSAAQRSVTPLVAVLVMVTIWLPYGPVWIALLLVVLAAFRTVREQRHPGIELAAH
jgi:low temperature requirement protein LtrA